MYKLTEETIKDYIKQPGKVFIQVWSEACGFCDKQKPVLDKVAAEYPDMKVGGININYTKKGAEQQPSEFRISHMEGMDTAPVLFVFQDGKMVGRCYKALLSESVLKKFIEEPTVEIYAETHQPKQQMSIEQYCAKASPIELWASIAQEREKIDQANHNIAMFRQEITRRGNQ